MAVYSKKMGDVTVTVELDKYNPNSKSVYTKPADDVTLVFNVSTDKPVSMNRLKKLWNADGETRSLIGTLNNVVERSAYIHPVAKEVQLNGWMLKVYSAKPKDMGGLAFAPMPKPELIEGELPEVKRLPVQHRVADEA